MSYFTVGYRLPKFFSTPLFGDRERFGLKIQADDPCWSEWQKTYLDFYFLNQKQSIGKIVNDAGYKVMSKLDMTGKRILEIGPGEISHIDNWNSIPDIYIVADVKPEMLERTAAKLKTRGIPYLTRLLQLSDFVKLPFESEEFDLIISFYTFEHLYSFADYLTEILRVMKQRGKLIGAIPCEGGFSWGIGRFLTTRRWLKKKTKINPDKIICWEHPNFADTILNTLDSKMSRLYLSYWPFGMHVIDLNLIIKFIYEKS
jgi:SAM-dependent methyltransferase